ncbi:MAG: hypothetical protein FJ034_06795, partial [Chloroflexi bacterium]|nr:hypothetical protein [Chloroflexota bacterium]
MMSLARPAGRILLRRKAQDAVEPLALSSLVALCLLAALAAGAVALDLVYAQRALPGLTVGGVAVGSLERPALRARIADAAAAWPVGAIEVSLGDRAWYASDASLGLTPDIERATGAALGFGKHGALPVRVGAWLGALAGGADLAMPLTPRGDALARWVDGIVQDAERPVAEGVLRLDTAGLTAVPPAVGRYVDRATFADRLREVR